MLATHKRIESTVLVLRMVHRIWTETKQQPGTARPGNMLGCCFVSFHFLWTILSTSTVDSLSTLQNKELSPIRTTYLKKGLT